MQNKIQKTKSPKLGSPLFMGLFFTLLAAATASSHILARFLFRSIKKDVFTYIEYAVNIFNGHGFITRILPPAHVMEHGLSPAPMPANRLMHPLFIALFRLVTDNWLVAATLASALFFVLSAPVIYFLARRVFSTRTALISASAYALAVPGGISEYFLYGYSEYAFIFPLLTAVLLVFNAKNLKTFIAAGLCLGLAGVARPALPVCLPPCLLLVFLVSPKPERIKNTAAFFACTLIPSLSVKWINILAFGNAALYENTVTEGLKPLICYTRLFQHMAPVYHIDLENMAELFVKDPMFITLFALKFWSIFQTVTGNFLNLISGKLVWLSCLAGLGLLVPAKTDSARHMKYFYLAMLLCHTLAISASFYFTRYFFPTVPLTIIMAASFVAFAVEKTPAKAKTALTIALCAGLVFANKNPFPKAMTWETRRAKDAAEIMASKNCYSFLNSFIPKGAPVVSDLHARVFMWRTNYEHTVMLLPRTFAMFEEIHKKISLDTILLVPGFINGDYGYANEWSNLYRYPQSFLGFEPQIFSHGISHSIVFTRNGNKLVRELTTQSRSEDTEKQLELLGKARLIRPNNETAEKLLAKANSKAQDKGAAILKEANAALKNNNLKHAWELFQRAGTFIAGLQTQELISKTKNKTLSQYNKKNDKQIKTTVSHLPAPKWLSDRRSKVAFTGFDTDICFDLRESRQVEEVKIWINDNTNRFSIPETIEVFSSIDNYNWTKINGQDFTDRRHNGKILGVNKLNSFGRFFKVKIRSKPHRPVAFSEIIISGYTPKD